MSNKPQIRIPSGGVNRTNLAHATSPEDWWTLLNLRPVGGGLEQTPLVIKHRTLTVLPHATVTPPSSAVRVLEHVFDSLGTALYLVGTEYDFRTFTADAFNDIVSPDVETRVPVVLMTERPIVSDTTTNLLNDVAGVQTNTLADVAGVTTDVLAATGTVIVDELNRQILLYGGLQDRFVSEGDYVTLEITSSTTAKWSFNGGPTITFTIASNVEADPVTGLAFAFMTTTGFNTGDIFKWERIGAVSTTAAVNCNAVPYNADVYITGYDRRILRMRDRIITGVGYNPVYGKHCAVFYNHLVVTQYALGAYTTLGGMVDTFDPAITPWRVAWSHLNDPDQFYPTDLNEADQYDLSSNGLLSGLNQGITGLMQLNDVLLIYTPFSIHSMRYVGLPAVMRIDLLVANVGSIFSDAVIKTPRGHFFIAADGVYVISGSTPQFIGGPVSELFFSEVQTPALNARWDWTFADYDSERNEVIWTYWYVAANLFEPVYQCKQMIYQIEDARFYFRNIPSVRAFAPDGREDHTRGGVYYGGLQSIYRDRHPVADYAIANVVFDSATEFVTSPVAETPVLTYGDFFSIKEHSAMALDAAYAFGTGVQVEHCAKASLSTTTAYTTLSPLWTPTIAERLLSVPRATGVAFSFRFTAMPTAAIYSGVQPGEDPWSITTYGVVADFKLYGYADFLYTGRAEQ